MKCYACGYQKDISKFKEFHMGFNLKITGEPVKLYACPECGNVLIEIF